VRKADSTLIARLACAACSLLVLCTTNRAHALEGLGETDEPRFRLVADDLTLTLEAEAELEIHDLQGRGGPGHDSPTDRRTLGTRSPFAELDSLSFALGLWLSERARAHALVVLDTRGAEVGGLWLDASVDGPSWLRHDAQLGLYPPIVYRDRRTERYPLIATVTWREPEMHVVYGVTAGADPERAASLLLSLAMMRPITFASVADSRIVRGTINVIAYGPARPFSGNAPVGGGRLRLTWAGAFAEAFGFVGTLGSEAGTDALRSTLTRFQDLPGYNAEEPERQDRSFGWAGGRVGYERHGLHAWAEVIALRESLLRRYGGYVQASYVLQLREPGTWFHRFEPLVRYEMLRIVDSASVQPSGRALRSPAPSEAPTWDFDALTIALRAHVYRDVVRVRAEYAWIMEHNGVLALGVANAPVRNNELLLQLEIGL